MLTRSDFAAACSGFVYPSSVVCVEIGSENGVAETVTDFVGHNLLVHGIGVGGIAHSRRKECATRIERSAADVAHVEECVVMLVEVVVGTTLHGEAEIVLGLRLSVFLVVVETVVTPVRSV